MRVRRLLIAVAAGGLTIIGVAACSSTVEGTGTLAEGVITPGPSGSEDPSGDPSESSSPSESESPTPTETTTSSIPTPTVDPTETRERLTCITVQSQIKSINDQFNGAANRAAQVGILNRGAKSVETTLKRAGLPRTDRIYVAGVNVLNQLKKLVTLANRGQNPSTGPYNVTTRAFSSICATI
jgi:hypothetical protein